MARKIRKKFGQWAFRLAVLLEFKRAGNAHVWKGQAPLQLTAEFRYSGNGFAVKFFKRGLVLKGINLTHATLHEEKNTTFRPARQMRLPWRKWIR